MESEVSAGGAADSCPQGVRGCAAVLCFLAERAYEASPCALVSCWEAPVHQQPDATAEEASAVPIRCGWSRRETPHAKGRPCPHPTRHGAPSRNAFCRR